MIAATRSNLNDAESRELEELFTECGDIFTMKSNDYRWTNGVYHCIDAEEALDMLAGA
jgi:hypothetical protein